MSKINSMILTTIFSVLILSMVISPTYPTLNNAYAAPAETPTLDAKCQAEANSNKPVTADCQLLNLLNEEVAARIAADIVLQDNIDAEEAARIAADGLLQDNIDDEEAARIAADIVLQGNIDDEETARMTKDTKLTTQADKNASEGQKNVDALITVFEVLEGVFITTAVLCLIDCVPWVAPAGIAASGLAVVIIILNVIDFSFSA